MRFSPYYELSSPLVSMARSSRLWIIRLMIGLDPTIEDFQQQIYHDFYFKVYLHGELEILLVFDLIDHEYSPDDSHRKFDP